MTDDTNGIADNLFSVFAKFGVQLGDIGSKLDRQNSNLKNLAKKADQPVLFEYTDNTILTGAGFGVIRLTGPDQGHVWLARNINIFDVTAGLAAVAVVGSFFLVRTSADSRNRAANQFAGYEVMDSITQGIAAANLSNPVTKLYSAEQVSARLNEELYIVIVGGTAAHQYSATIRVIDYEEAASKQEWLL